MPTRDESLRRMLESHPAATGMTEEERQELADHFCDAVEEKVRGGRSELQAAAEAFTELGDLGRIARAFPRGVAAATPEGLLIAVREWTVPAAAYLLLAGLWYVSAVVAPGSLAAARDSGLDMPALVRFFLAATGHGGNLVAAFAALPVVAPLLLRRLGWRPVFQTACALVGLVALALVLSGVAGGAIVGALAFEGRG